MSDWLDKLLMVVGVLAACIHGMTMPFTVRIFSDAVDMFVEDEKKRSMLALVHRSRKFNLNYIIAVILIRGIK